MRWVTVVAVLVTGIAALPTAASGKPGSRFTTGATGQRGVIASESYAASRVGRAVLEDGGNAIDAAVASVFALGVARPQSCGIGGGGFMLYRSRTGATRALDFRETSGAAMRPDTLAGPGLHREFTGHLTVGVPGTVAGMDSALRRYGTLSLREAIAPAERLAREGFRVPASLSASMAANARRLALFPAAGAQYLVDGARPYAPGSTLRQRDLAATLRRIQRGGTDAFYEGTIARRIVRDMRAPRPDTRDPGILTVRDFARYGVKWRTPIRGRYRGSAVLGMPPPTSGGIAISEMLNILGAFDLARAGQSSADALHLIAEAQKIAFADRNVYVADPDLIQVPTGQLTSKTYAGARSAEIDLRRARTYGPGLGTPPSQPPARAAAAADTSDNATGTTTHISVIDRRGAAVSLTCTIEQEFGSAVVAPGTGFLLNNELTDFSPAGTANQADPGKRPRSSMSPTIVVGPEGRPTLVLGGAGGVRIIMGTLLPIINTIDFGGGVASAVDAERIDNSGPRL
ncbi:MAG: gamma-glutamyltransferase, partial [Solirubrobacterales bacterium]|nr:gamma-glutamyltransferase [Solirubrobacterales bacterium]